VAGALSPRGVIEAEHLSIAPAPVLTPPPATDKSAEIELADPEALRRTLVALLEQHRGNISHVARDLGKARMQIHRWLKRFDLDPDAFRG
jgi:transcriptional regulator of acetoin/glycerol metabolism